MMTDPRTGDPRAPENLVDLDRYPLTTPDAPGYAAEVARIRADLARDGAASLPGFLRPEAVELMAFEAEALSPLAYTGPTEVSPYFFNYDLAATDDPTHPTKRRGKRALGQVAYDLIPEESALRRLFFWEPLPAFLAAALDLPRLYRTEDPYQALNISVMGEGGRQQWHFDRSAFVTTLLVQAAEGGGHFEYVPSIREDSDEHFDEVRAVLDGDESRVKRIEIEPGMLNLFKGHYSMHRVTEVTGARRRLQTILGYSATPGVVGSLKSSVLHYGPRVAIKSGLSAAETREMMGG
jgi:hypothetical protein